MSPVRLRASILAGGFVGTLGRALVDKAFQSEIPWSTVLANLAGTALLGVLVGRMIRDPTRAHSLGFLGVGLCGALTTFGSMMVQARDLTGSHGLLIASSYVVGMTAAGLLVAALTVRAAEER
ncbi:MAG: CrcB family protein [Acidimicrobiia bacterium]|nr:CrcB family protein [Acidimicrobiia bacterium]MDH4308905.1 CrcB family protein [Acidimicrobiia bacterium]MDH5295002.1 CrcB family protein [Acidimicrobiia bacterium]